ncbi:MAG: hypothetical protein ACE5FE_01475 [Acidiferrobacterales bacterium]
MKLLVGQELLLKVTKLPVGAKDYRWFPGNQLQLDDFKGNGR